MQEEIKKFSKLCTLAALVVIIAADPVYVASDNALYTTSTIVENGLF